jgi:hypothetical protein
MICRTGNMSRRKALLGRLVLLGVVLVASSIPDGEFDHTAEFRVE